MKEIIVNLLDPFVIVSGTLVVFLLLEFIICVLCWGMQNVHEFFEKMMVRSWAVLTCTMNVALFIGTMTAVLAIINFIHYSC